jgi:FkbM family methyltransferase
MNSLISKLKYHGEKFLFEKYGLPKVKGDKISKIVLKNFLPQNPVIIDCGAHDGADSIEFAKLLKNASIYSFEPVDELYKRLLNNTALYENIKSYKIALGDKDGWQDFYISEGGSDASSSLLKPKEHLIFHPDTFFKKKISVNTLTLDSWAARQGVKHVDLLWLDMQGFELNMIKASPEILATVKIIHTEVSTKEIYLQGPLYNEYKTYLQSIGFEVFIEAIPAGWYMGNVLFIRKQDISTSVIESSRIGYSKV